MSTPMLTEEIIFNIAQITPMSDSYIGRMLHSTENLHKQGGPVLRATMLGHGHALVALSNTPDNRASLDMIEQITSLFCAAILGLDKWREELAYSHFLVLFGEKHGILHDHGEVWLHRVQQSFTPNYRAFWRGYQSLFGGIVDTEIDLLASWKDGAIDSWLWTMEVAHALPHMGILCICSEKTKTFNHVWK